MTAEFQHLEEVRAKQRNLIWPQTVINGRAVDVFFWRGSPNPTLSQRVAAFLFGTVLLVYGLITLSVARADHSLLWMFVAWGIILMGARAFRNGFPRPARETKPRERFSRAERR